MKHCGHRGNTVQRILAENWQKYLETHSVKPYQKKEVEKAIRCHDKTKGFIRKDNTILTFGCNSRICSSCGKRYADQWADSLKDRLFSLPHRHVVMTIPRCLWRRMENWERLKKYMDTSANTIHQFLSYVMRRDLMPGIVMVLHTFGKDMKFNPHIHILITDGGFSETNFVKCRRMKATSLGRKWKFEVLKNMVRDWYRIHLRYPKGFYVWTSRRIDITGVSRYICRYVRHPAIASSRIMRDSRQYVIFNHARVCLKMDTNRFIASMIQHIPPSQFKMVRYYGAYGRNSIFYSNLRKQDLTRDIRASLFASSAWSRDGVLAERVTEKCYLAVCVSV